MTTQPQTLRNLSGQPHRATVPLDSRPHNQLNPEMIVQVIGYGLMWLGTLLFAVAVVAMAIGSLR